MNRNHHQLTRRQGLAIIAAAGTLPLSVLDAWSQSFPTRTLRVVLPVGPGSGLDARAREVTQKLSELLGEQIVVENRPGAGGIIAMNLVAKAPPDGFTLALAGIAPVAYYSVLYRKLPFAPEDFAPVSLLATGPSSVYASPELAPRSVQELVAYAKARPGQLTFASQGIGTFQHLAGEWFKVAAGVDLLHVPYKDYGQILTDLQTGRVTLLFDSTGAVLGHVQGGKLKAYTVTGAERLGSLPKMPTFAEAGLPEFAPGINYGVFAPAGTPPAVVEILSRACARVQRSKEIQDSLARFAFSSLGTSPAEFESYIATERERWIKVVRASGVQLDY